MKIKIFSIILIAGITILTGASCKETINLSDNSDPRNTSYLINGESLKLKNGKSEQQSPTRPVIIKTSIFETTKGDINDDGKEDAVVILTKDPGGSGTFYYAAVAVNSKYGGYAGSNAVLLGDRIAPQTVRINNGIIEVNYATRNLDENFTIPPSVGVTKYLIYSNGQLEEVTFSNLGVKQEIIQLLSKNYNAPTSTLIVNFESILEKFAKGTVNLAGQGGAVWFAVNTTKGWELASIGNGIVPCEDINRYDFPKILAPKCLSQNNIVDREDPYITWEETKKLIQNCKVKSVMQSHNLNISLELKNGIKHKSLEPKIDDIINFSVESQPSCGKIIMATE